MKMLSSSNSILLFSRHTGANINGVFAKFIAQIYILQSVGLSPNGIFNICFMKIQIHVYVRELPQLHIALHCIASAFEVAYLLKICPLDCVIGILGPCTITWSPLPWDDTHLANCPAETRPLLSYNQTKNLNIFIFQRPIKATAKWPVVCALRFYGLMMMGIVVSSFWCTVELTR